MTARKLQALRNLAERPGTEAEGKVAREMLAKFEAKTPEKEWKIEPLPLPFDTYMRAYYDAPVRDIIKEKDAWGAPMGRAFNTNTANTKWPWSK